MKFTMTQVLNKVGCIMVFACFMQCQTMAVTNEQQSLTNQRIVLGSIGIDKSFIAERDYNTITLPNYEKPIEVTVRVVPFNNRAFKSYMKAQNEQSQDIGIRYNDTLIEKPQYLKIEISDRLAVLNSLKTETNANAFQFLKNNSKTHVITALAMAVEASTLATIANAQEVFLETTGVKTYSLNIYKDAVLQQKIGFNEAVVFAYQSSYCCWKQNDKYQVALIDLVEDNDNCPEGSFRTSSRAHKNVNYFKF